MEEIKDLGGLVNKDIAFSKLPQGAVYDSQNFRITTNDGSTSAARETIRGNKQVIDIPQNPCISALTFTTPLIQLLQAGVTYVIQLQINGNNVTNTLTVTYTSPSDLVTAVANFINADADFQASGITATANTANNSVTLVIPDCSTISVGSFTFTGGSTTSTFPYAVFDPECQYNTYPNVGLDYTTLDGYTGGPLWSRAIGDPDVTSNMGVGITNQAGTIVDANATRIELTATSITTSVSEMLAGVNGAVNNLNNIGAYVPLISQSTFEYFSNGPYNFEASFYIKKTADVSGTVTFLLDLGSTVDTSFDPSLTFVTINGKDYVQLDQVTFTAGSTDIDYLDLSGNEHTFTWSAGDKLYGVLGTATAVGTYAFDLYVKFDADDNIGAPTFSTTFYLDYLRVTGPVLNFASLVNFTNITPSILSGDIIGWVLLRDDIYLFTTDGTFNPDDPSTGPFTSTGQIWKFTYDKAGDYGDPNNYSLILIYSNPGLNFTVYRPIANPGMIESRYENNQIQKIYWTDNYNVPRQINVADPNVSTLTVEDLNLQPSLSMDLPLVTEVIDGGELLVGVYQVAYRLKNINGSETRFGRTSNLIPIIDRPEATATVSTYFPLKNIRDITTKSLRIQVNNLDTDYDTIEFVTIYYFDEFSEPEINIVKEAFIPNTGSVEVIITGAEEQIPVTVDEFTAFNTFIKRVKTLAAKKQTLFLGNITTSDQEIIFDARTYRFPITSLTTNITTESTGNSDTVTYDTSTGQFNYNGISNNPVPDTHDCIQSYDDQSPVSDQNYLYQPNTNILGGQGPNVKYEFFTDNVKLDNKFDDSPSGGAYGPHMTPDINTIISFNSIDRDYVSAGSSLSNNGSPYVYDLYVGYRRDELYRFGIVFFDEVDNPTFVNWIGDIRMPHIFMPNSSAGTPVDNTPNNRSRLNYELNPSSGFSTDITYYDTTNDDLYGKPLGVKFTVDFSSVASKYKKAMIVRTPLKATDKHILGQGLFRPTYKTDTLPTDGDNVFVNNPYRGNYAYGSYNDAWYDCWVMDSPEFLFADFNNLGNDTIDVLGLLNKTDFAYLAVNYQGTNYGPANSRLWTPDPDKRLTGFRTKNYQFVENATRPASIKNTSSNNPYNVILSKALSLGGGALHYPTGITTLNASAGGFTNSRTVYNCTPRNVNATAVMAVSNGTNPGNSYNGKSIFVQLASTPANNWNVPAVGGNDFLTVDNWNSQTNELFSFYTANYKRDVPSPFGGLGYFARANSEYIGCNNLIDISNKSTPITTKVYGGDTAISVVDHVIQFPDRAQAITYSSGSRVDVFLHMVYFPAETSIAVDYRRSLNNSPSIDHNVAVPNRTNNLTLAYDIAASQWSTQIEVSEYFNVDPVFNHTDKTVYRYFPKPALTDPQEIYDCRVWRSEPKIDGELVESWSIFKPGAYLDVESAYGPLNNLIIFQDKLFYFQDRAFGVLQVAAQKLLTGADNDLSELVLGSSGILERYDYISTKTGTKNQFSMSVSDYSMLWFDTLARKIYRYKPGALEPLSDVKGYSAYVYKHTGGDFQTFDNPYIFKGIHSTYDYRHLEFYMTFVNKDANNNFIFADTLVYNDYFDGFIGSFTHYPKVYINDKINIFSPFKPLSASFDSIYVHNYGDYGRFYGAQILKDSKLSFVVNSNPTVEKVFTNLEVVAESFGPNTTGDINYDSLSAIDYTDFFDTLRVYNNYQNTDVISTTGLSRRHKTIWNLKVPSDRVLDVNQNIFDSNNLSQIRPAITRRMKDKWFVVDLTYSNQLSQGQNKLVAHSAKAIYSINSR